MEFLANLWLPIVASAVLVFVVSSLLQMLLPIHRSDYSKLSDEEALRTAVRSQDLGSGEYMFPCPDSMKEMASPEMVQKYEEGPVGYLTILANRKPAMGKSLAQWFLFSLLISVFVAYTAAVGLSVGAHYLTVFRLTGAAAILGYAIPHLHDSIWKGRRCSVTLKFVFDGIIYSLVTAGTFGWLWPGRI